MDEHLPMQPNLISFNPRPRVIRWLGRFILVALIVVAFVRGASTVAAAAAGETAVDPKQDWPGWRGPTADGIAAPGQILPIRWSETNNVVWRVPVPGRGHGSPCVIGDRVYLPTSEREPRQSQSVLCYDRATGKPLWQREVHGGEPNNGKHANSSCASSTIACDGQRLFVTFLNAGAVHATALDLEGKILWQRKICDYVAHQGFGASPVVYGSLVLVSADHRGGGTLAGLDRVTGEVVWSVARPKIANYTTPAIVRAGGRAQMVLAGCNLLTSLDPATGGKLWEVECSTEECVTTAASDGVRVFASGGYPRNHTVSVLADGSGKIAWQSATRLYVPSPIIKDGHIYAVLDSGIAVCWKSDTGAECWKERLGGDFYSSPVMAGDRIYATNLGGKTFVYEATPGKFQVLAENQLGDEVFATPSICGNRIYLRVAKNAERRQEFLFCVGN